MRTDEIPRGAMSWCQLVLLGLLCLAPGIPAGSVNLGQKKDNAPDFSGNGFHSLNDFNNGVGLSGASLYLVALGDFNSDKYNDLFTVSADRSSMQVYTWSSSDWRFEAGSVLDEHTNISYVIPSDFNYDGLMDVAIGGVGTDGVSYHRLHLHADRSSGLNSLETGYISLGAGMSNGLLPIFLDLNGDMRVDMLGTTTGLKRAVWPSTTASSPVDFYTLTDPVASAVQVQGCAATTLQTCYTADHTTPQLLQSSLAVAAADMDGDCVSDLLMVVDSSPCAGLSPGARALEVWIRAADTQKLALKRVYALPDWAVHVSVQDLDRDGDLDAVVLVAASGTAAPHEAVFMHNSQQEMCSSQWELESSSCRPQQQLCRADPQFSLAFADCATSTSLDVSSVSGLSGATLASFGPFPQVPMLRFGDFDLDGYPDVLAGLEEAGDTSVQLWRNTHRSTPGGFELVSVPELSVEGAFGGAFMDLDDDMSMDLVALGESSGVPALKFLLNDNDYDAFAVKVLGSNGVCPEWCDGLQFPDPKPYGVNFPGNTFKLTVVNTEGDKRAQIVPQLQSGSCGMSLESGATLVGLGRTNNYLEEVYMGIPFGKFKLWTNLVPNSQLVGFPHEKSQPDTWLLELFVPTDTKILAVVLALLGTLLVLSVPVGFLTWQERQEDKREKLDSSHLFSYDAL